MSEHRKSDAPSDLILVAKGSALRGGRYDLRFLDLLLSNYRLLIDQTLPVIVGQRTLTARLKQKFRYEVEVRDGSLELLLDIVFDNIDKISPIAAALVTDGGRQLARRLSKLWSGAIELRRVFVNLAAAGRQPNIKISQSGTGNQAIVTDARNSTIVLNDPTILLVADSTRPSFDRLIAGIDGSDLTSVELAAQGGAITRLSPSDIEITGRDVEELPTVMTVVGRLDAVTFSSHKGHLVTDAGRYPVTWDEAQRSKIKRFVDEEGVLFKVCPRVDNRRFRDEPVSLHITDCWRPSQASLDV